MAPKNLVMVALTLLMYCMSTAHIALVLKVDLMAFFDEHATEGRFTILNEQEDPLHWVQNMLEIINVSDLTSSLWDYANNGHFNLAQCVIGDSIVCWRTWVLWGRDWRVLTFPLVCIVGSLGRYLWFCK